MLKGKRIVVTGVTGQVVHAIAKRLAPHNDVWAIARFSEPGSRDLIESFGITTRIADFAKGVFEDVPTDFEYVLHFAANTRTTTSEEGMVINAEGAGILMNYFRGSKAFFHCSTSGVYAPHPDPYHASHEEIDQIGGGRLGHYPPTKTAAEGAVRAFARVLNLPTVIARLNVAYGTEAGDGGLPGMQLDKLVNREPIRLPKSWTCIHQPIHEDDLTAHIGPLLEAASVPATVVNWGGDEQVKAEDWVRYLGEVTGIEPVFEFTDENPLPQGILDNTRRLKITGPCTVPWREGMREMVRLRYPDLKLVA